MNWSQKFTHLHHLCRSTLIGCSWGDGSRSGASLHRDQSGGYLCIQCGRFLQPEWHPAPQIPPAFRRTLGWWCHLETDALKRLPPLAIQCSTGFLIWFSKSWWRTGLFNRDQIVSLRPDSGSAPAVRGRLDGAPVKNRSEFVAWESAKYLAEQTAQAPTYCI